MAQLTWHFPLPRTHTGALLGNGVMGLMVWGEELLHLTVGRAGFWDHRGANDFTARGDFDTVRGLLERGDGAALRKLFTVPQATANDPPCPTQLGLGRLQLRFSDGYRPQRLHLDTHSGIATIVLANPQGAEARAQLHLAMDRELAWLALPQGVALEAVELLPAFHWIGAERRAYGMVPPHTQQDAQSGSMQQDLPADPAAALAYRYDQQHLLVSSALGDQPRSAAQDTLDPAVLSACHEVNRRWWSDYVQRSARLQVSDPVIQEIWDYGLYKQAGLTTPGGVAATLQGPWLEEYQVPPWSCDYHFNINLQMVYWPCLATGHPEHLQPLWDLLKSWLPQLRAVAQRFFHDDEALMLPHAVDDRCRTVGAFWTGCIDSACTAWMAQLAWQYYQYTADSDFLRELAWPLLHGAFASYWAMLEEDDQGALRLPVSVSPEFKGARDDAWGVNASFQLAACHFLAQTLPQAAELLQVEVDPRWQQVRECLPPYTVGEHPLTREYPERKVARLELWQGMDLVESHRHHSHLGAIYPFMTIDPDAEEHREIVRRSIYHWVRMGPGAWSGWCVPWASMLQARCGHGDGAAAWLHFWRQHFVNEGRGTLHDAAFFGATTLYQQGAGTPGQGHYAEIMQIEAGQGALHACSELLVLQRAGLIRIHPAPVASWQHCSFDQLYCAGGFVIGADLVGGRVRSVRVLSQRSAHLQLEHGFGSDWLLNGQPQQGALLQCACKPGETLLLEAVKGTV